MLLLCKNDYFLFRNSKKFPAEVQILYNHGTFKNELASDFLVFLIIKIIYVSERFSLFLNRTRRTKRCVASDIFSFARCYISYEVLKFNR